MKQAFAFFQAAFMLVLIQITGWAQDNNYWTNQFGTRASLMGGAVVGGIRDNTAIFYNPAALAFIDTSSISVNANLYRLENIRVINAVGDEKDLKTLNIGAIPLLVGGKIKTKNPRMHIGYGLVVPLDFSFKAGSREQGFFAISDSPDSPGDEEYTGQVNVSSELKETLAILGMSWKLGENSAIGISHIFSSKSHRYTEATIARMFLNDPLRTLVAVNDLESVRYSQISYIPKIGINTVSGNWALGAAFTLPALRLFGNGTVTADVTANQVNLFGNGRIDVSGSDLQEDLKTRYKRPWSVSAGVVRNGLRGRWGLSAEYFGALKPYSILTPKNGQFLRPSSLFPQETTDKYLQVRQAAKAVLNAALGYEHYMNERTVLTFSVRTDFSSYNNDMAKERGIKPYITTWNLYHLTGGITKTLNRHDLSLGLSLGFGADNNYQQSINLDDPEENNFLRGQLQVAEAKYFSASFLLGYTFKFVK